MGQAQKISRWSGPCATRVLFECEGILFLMACVLSMAFVLPGLILGPVVGQPAWEPALSLSGDVFLPLAKAAAIPVVVSILLLVVGSFGYRARSCTEEQGTAIATFLLHWAHSRGYLIASAWTVKVASTACRPFEGPVSGLPAACTHRVVRLTPSGLSGATSRLE